MEATRVDDTRLFTDYYAVTASGHPVHTDGSLSRLLAWVRGVMDGEEDVIVTRGRKVIAVLHAAGGASYFPEV